MGGFKLFLAKLVSRIIISVIVAFQSYSDFHAFLKTNATGAGVSDVAPATNFILEERLSGTREGDFVAEGSPKTGSEWDNNAFRSTYGNHFERHVGVPSRRAGSCKTFQDRNGPALLQIESHRDVVRLESVEGLFRLNPSVYLSERELTVALDELTTKGMADMNADERDRLQLWLKGLNAKRDARPMFVVPWGEVTSMLAEDDWATRLRNTMGLVHLGGTVTNPLPVVLMRYNLSRSEKAARKARAKTFAATPTVLEAGTNRGPNPAFFPFPPTALGADEMGFGQTVDLSDSDGLNYKPELLHCRIDYELEDFHRRSHVEDRIDDTELEIARQRHFSLLENDFRHGTGVARS